MQRSHLLQSFPSVGLESHAEPHKSLTSLSSPQFQLEEELVTPPCTCITFWGQNLNSSCIQLWINWPLTILPTIHVHSHACKHYDHGSMLPCLVPSCDELFKQEPFCILTVFLKCAHYRPSDITLCLGLQGPTHAPLYLTCLLSVISDGLVTVTAMHVSKTSLCIPAALLATNVYICIYTLCMAGWSIKAIECMLLLRLAPV